MVLELKRFTVGGPNQFFRLVETSYVDIQSFTLQLKSHAVCAELRPGIRVAGDVANVS